MSKDRAKGRPERPLLAEERQEVILDRIRATGAVRVAELVETLDVSDMTIRRDIAELAERGHLRRVHGGAVEIAHAKGRDDEPARVSRRAEKHAIAMAAYEHIRAGSTIAIGVGTSSRFIAQRLASDTQLRPVVVVTNSLEVSDLLAAAPDRELETIVVGGSRSANDTLVGPLAVELLHRLRVDQLFLGVHAISAEHGITTPNLLEAETDRALIESAAEVIVMADHHKWSLTGLGLVAPIDAIDVLITDERISGNDLTSARERIGKVELVSLKDGEE